MGSLSLENVLLRSRQLGRGYLSLGNTLCPFIKAISIPPAKKLTTDTWFRPGSTTPGRHERNRRPGLPVGAGDIRPESLAGLGRRRGGPVPSPPRRPRPSDSFSGPQPVRPQPAYPPCSWSRPLSLRPAQHLCRLPAAADGGLGKRPFGGYGRGDRCPASPAAGRSLAAGSLWVEEEMLSDEVRFALR